MQRPTEDELIATLFAPIAGQGGLGLRDDAALITPAPGHDLVITKDMLIAGVHFFADDPPDVIARKSLRVNLSDLAAKGATPLGFLLGLGLPPDWTGDWLSAFTRALGDDSRRFGCPLLGGDTVKTPGPLTVSITAFGEVESGRMVPRTGARLGDFIYVSGTIGDAAIGLRVRRGDPVDATWIAGLDESAADALRDRYLLPHPRLGLRPALLAYASAAMDVSDGLAGDLGKMVRLAGLSLAVSVADVPLSHAVRAAVGLAPSLLATALTGGDDYEILCAIPQRHVAAFELEAHRTGIAVTRIGVTERGDQDPGFFDVDGKELVLAVRRFSHF